MATKPLQEKNEVQLAEGMGFEPMREVSPPNRLAGGRTRPLCDPSYHWPYYNHKISPFTNHKKVSL